MAQNEERKHDQMRRWGLKLALVLFDVFAVNFSYYLALLLRFYVNHEFHMAGNLFLPLFLKFAPYYTVCCLLVFAAFKLYSGMWKYAGVNDVNRVAQANLITFLIQVIGTMLFMRGMPITYYLLGAVIQFALICVSRFSYRILSVEFSRYAKGKSASVNVMLVGAGESARSLLRSLESDQENVAHPVCVADYRNSGSGLLFDGLPVVTSLEGIREAVEKYKVKGLIVADPLMPQELRQKVKDLCGELELGFQDYSGFTQNAAFGLSLSKLLEYVNGSLTVSYKGKTQSYENGEQAVSSLSGKYVVKSVSVRDEKLWVEIDQDILVTPDNKEAWVQDYEKETGESVSFF